MQLGVLLPDLSSCEAPELSAQITSLEVSLSSGKKKCYFAQAKIQKLETNLKKLDNRNTMLEVDLAAAEVALKDTQAQLESQFSLEKVICEEAQLWGEGGLKLCLNSVFEAEAGQ